MIPWLEGAPGFPPLEQALTEPNGLLAAGGALEPQWLLTAYRQGIFPWYSPGEPILWWSPDPRLVLLPDELHISRSLRKTLRRRPFELRVDSAFSAVIEACAANPRLRLHAPEGALYAFPGIDTAGLDDFDDHRFALDLLTHEGVLVVPGTSFNVPYRNHFRVTLLPEPAQIGEVFARIEHALDRWERQPDAAARAVHA